MCHLTLLLPVLSLIVSCTAVVLEEPSGIFDDSSGYGPVFEEEPVDIIYPEESQEDKIIMTCRARAMPPATYKWRLNNWEIEIPDKEKHYSLMEGSLVIDNPEKSKHVGNYSCLATNEYGTVISREASVQFGYLDMFSTEERETVQVKEGQGLVLLCAPPPHFPDDLIIRWMLNEFPTFIPLDQRRFVSQTTGNLYIAAVTASDRGNYSCFVSSPSIAKSVFSKFIPLIPKTEHQTRNSAPDINVISPNTHALVGQNISLECFALGRPVPKIVWNKVNGELPANHEISADGGLLRLFNVQYKDEGLYQCEAQNIKGKDRQKAHLYVEAAPQWVKHISSSERDMGSDYTMSCVATGKPKPNIHFLKNGQMYGKHELNFKDLTSDDSGMYQCIAENHHGVIRTSAELRVFVGAPSFELNPVKHKLLGAKNGRVVIECKPKAAPRPKFTWSKGTELLHNSSRISIWEDGSLEIRNITKSDEGAYTCFAVNERGKANSTGSLTVTEATKITLAPSNTDVTVGGFAKMQCAASHDPSLDLTFIWSLNGNTIDVEKENEFHLHINESEAGLSSCELIIKSTHLNHAGRYACTVETPVDNVTASALLVVRGPPGPPGGVRVVEEMEESVKLRWSHGKDNFSPISKYSIQYRETITEGDWKDASTDPSIIEGNVDTATVKHLIPWMEYEFRVIATNTLGTGEPSDPSPKVTTLETSPVVAPSNINGGGGIGRELTITWTPVQPQYFYGRDFGYLIAFRPHNSTVWHRVTVTDPKVQSYVHKDPSIPPATKFDVKIKAFNSKGEGPFSNIANIYSAQDAPSKAPTNVTTRVLSATEAIVSWLPVMEHTVEGYQVRYWRKSMEKDTSTERIPSRETHTRLENLKPDTLYIIDVRAFNGAGYGPASHQHQIHTSKAPPSRRPKITWRLEQDGTKVRVAWDNVKSLPNESTVDGYKVLYKPEGTNGSAELYTTNDPHISLPRLKNLNYVVEVIAQSEGGDGPMAQVHISASGVLTAQAFGFCTLALMAVLSLAL